MRSNADGSAPRRWAPGRVAARTALGCLLGLLTLSLGGCASGGGGGDTVLLRRDLQTLGLHAPIVPFQLSDEIRAWLQETVPAEGPPRQRLQLLLDQMVRPDGLAIQYRAGFTGTASEVFASRQANCLGFMNLFVGAARELDIPAFFVAVVEAESFGRQGDFVLLVDHVAAGYGAGQDLLLLDFSVGPSPEYEQVESIEDREAIGRYYSNRGAEALLAGDLNASLRWLEDAVRIDPEAAAAWVNLGVTHRRAQKLDRAEEFYRRALEVDPRNQSAYRNLAALLERQGLPDQARGLLELTHRLGTTNPYNYLNLGDWSLASGRLTEAKRFYRQALSLDDGAAEPYAALGELALAAERPARARRWLRRALKIDPENFRVVRLERKLGAEPSDS